MSRTQAFGVVLAALLAARGATGSGPDAAPEQVPWPMAADGLLT